jgi:hypothetical protein
LITETGGVAVVASNQAADASLFEALSRQYRESDGLDSGVFLYEDSAPILERHIEDVVTG